jgi:hypothetical protein
MTRWTLTGRNTLDTTTTSKTTDGRLGYALDVVAKNLAVTLRTSLAETLSALAACRELLVRCLDDDVVWCWTEGVVG